NGYRHLSERPALTEAAPEISRSSNGQITSAPQRSAVVPERERRKILIAAAKQVGPALFFSLLIIVVSFLPVFLLVSQECRMLRPLAWTKTLAVGFSSLLAIRLVQVLTVLFSEATR